MKKTQARLSMERFLTREMSFVAWETDNAVLITNSRGRIEWTNPAFSALIGYARENIVGKEAAILFEASSNKDVFELARAELLAHKKFRSDILLRTATGGLVWLDMNIKTIVNRKGVVRRYVGIGNDVTERKRAEESLKRSEARAQLLREVAASANSAVTVWAAFQTALEGLGRHMGWPLGHAYVLDETGTRLVDGGQWHVTEPERFRDFIEATRCIVFATGVGLPGHVMEAGRAIWIEDLQGDPRFVRTPEARLSGVKSGFAFPIREGDTVAAVLEFFTTEEVPPNSDLIELSEQVSIPLGIVIARKHTEEELGKLSRAVENSPASVVITNRKGDIEYVNSKFATLTGYSREEVLGKNPRILAAGHHPRAYYERMWRMILAGEEWNGEFVNRKKNGDIYWEQASISPVRDAAGAIMHFVAVKEDITERRKVAADLSRAKDAAEAANRAKGVFLAQMSHEIRTPMNAILGFTQLLRSDAGLTAAHRETLDTIARSGEHLLALIDDVLEMSRIESGKAVLAPSEFDLNELVETVESMFRVRVEGKGLRFTVSHLSETRRSIIADKGKLRQILVNLIGNAVKFTTHGSVELRVGVERNGPGGLTLHAEVLDTGPGISVQEQDRLFRYFEQTTAGLQSGTGTGLGLAICREYVTLMGGVIGVESQLGQGSAFHFHVSVREHRGGAEIDHEEIVESSDALAAPSLRMDSLSQDFVGELRQAALSADIDRILRWVGEAERLDPRLARRVRELAQQFDYPALLDLSGYEEEA